MLLEGSWAPRNCMEGLVAKGRERESSREWKDRIPQQHGLPRGHAAVLGRCFVTIVILMHEKGSLSLPP